MSKRVHATVGSYTLKRTTRRTLAITVLPDGSIEAVAPKNAKIKHIEAKLTKRTAWITRQQAMFANIHSNKPMKRFCQGASHRYLGRQYQLKIRHGKKSSVSLRGAYFHIEVASDTSRAVSTALSTWYRDRAKEQFSKRLIKWQPWCIARSLPAPKLVIRDMPKRWGSAHRDGRIYLNPMLICAPSPCVDYVICHEVCHIKHPYHDRKFYAELSRIMPYWKKNKQRLESLV